MMTMREASSQSHVGIHGVARRFYDFCTDEAALTVSDIF
jgi:hypothetical protein